MVDEGEAVVVSGEVVSMMELSVTDITKGCFVCYTENGGLFFTTKATLYLHSQQLREEEEGGGVSYPFI